MPYFIPDLIKSAVKAVIRIITCSTEDVKDVLRVWKIRTESNLAATKTDRVCSDVNSIFGDYSVAMNAVPFALMKTVTLMVAALRDASSTILLDVGKLSVCTNETFVTGHHYCWFSPTFAHLYTHNAVGPSLSVCVQII